VRIEQLWRYPVKSMLGEQITTAHVEPAGVRGDRAFAVVDEETRKIASAKQPRLWRALLQATATHATPDGDGVRISLPCGKHTTDTDPDVHHQLSSLLGRAVRLSATPPDAPDIDRADPDEVLARGVDAVVAAPQLVLGEAVPAPTFLDYAPLHLITTATLEHIGQDAIRYRPNLVIRTPPGHPPFAENDWVGQTAVIGDAVVARIVLPTPRCSIPTLEHGPLPRDPAALRSLMARNRVEVPGFGILPAAGVYATVERAGAVGIGAPFDLAS
jgi:uncharacterized protein YcbX